MQERRSNIRTYTTAPMYFTCALGDNQTDNRVWRFIIDWVLFGLADLPRVFQRSSYAKFIYLHRILRGSLADVGFYLLD